MNEVDACRAFLIEVLTILAKDLDNLADARYQQASDMSNRFFRNIPGTSIQVKVDLITGEFPEIATDETHHRIQELAV